MSYNYRTNIKELDIRIPKEDVQRALNDGITLTHWGLRIDGPEGESNVVKEEDGIYHLTLKLFAKSLVIGEYLEELAVKFKGTYKAIDVGEDGEVYPVSIVDGKAKRVSLAIEED